MSEKRPAGTPLPPGAIAPGDQVMSAYQDTMRQFLALQDRVMNNYFASLNGEVPTAGAFTPPPRVESAVARLVPLPAPPFPLPDRERFARVVASAFSMRRKTLRNSLRGLVDGAGFAETGIDPGRRAETLSPAEFAALAATPVPRVDV